MIQPDQSLEPDWDQDNINLDIAMVKRIARRKGVPHTQLMATWLHERIEREKGVELNASRS